MYTSKKQGLVSPPPTTEETGAMGREIESRQGIRRVVALKYVYMYI
jgi:hypothetical protein